MDKTEWWATLDRHFFQLARIIHKFLPQHSVLKAQTLQAARDPAMANLLEAAWAAAPDHPSIHSIPGWGVLCDLCSERDALIEPIPDHDAEPCEPETCDQCDSSDVAHHWTSTCQENADIQYHVHCDACYRALFPKTT